MCGQLWAQLHFVGPLSFKSPSSFLQHLLPFLQLIATRYAHDSPVHTI